MDKTMGSKYLGAHIVMARSLTVGEDCEYQIFYPGGPSRYIPKDVFEASYLHLDKTRPAPSITQDMVDRFIKRIYVSTEGDKTTVCRAVLRNGYEIVESSSCVSKENYDEKVGVAICEKKIKDKVWALLGFLLQTAVEGVKGD